MIVAIHQPNYLPWNGFFHKLANCDKFVFLDNVPFSTNSFQNRTRVKTSTGAEWLTVPVLVKRRHGQPTHEVQINVQERWRLKHWRTIEQRYSRAPYYGFLAECLEPVYRADWKRLADLNIELINRIAWALKISTKTLRATDLGVDGNRSQLLSAICESVGADTYLSGPSGRNYLDVRAFRERGIQVRYNQFIHQTYPQLYGPFVPGLSVIDLLANCGSESRDLLSERLAGEGESGAATDQVIKRAL